MHDFYKILGLEASASPDAVRQAFRRLAREWHPDTSTAPDATSRLQLINEAYAVLKNPARRKAHDGELRARLRQPKAEAPLAWRPVRCCECGKLTAQPRMLQFRQVVSFVVWSKVDVISGVFCRRCAARVGLAASARSSLFGWWAVPLGPLFTLGVLVGNATGGRRSEHVDRRLALLNAESFLRRQEFPLALALASKVHAETTGPEQRQAERIMDIARVGARGLDELSLADAWKPQTSYLLSHLSMMLWPVLALIAAFALRAELAP